LTKTCWRRKKRIREAVARGVIFKLVCCSTPSTAGREGFGNVLEDSKDGGMAFLLLSILLAGLVSKWANDAREAWCDVAGSKRGTEYT
jgi:hypothetical protein